MDISEFNEFSKKHFSILSVPIAQKSSISCKVLPRRPYPGSCFGGLVRVGLSEAETAPLALSLHTRPGHPHIQPCAGRHEGQHSEHNDSPPPRHHNQKNKVSNLGSSSMSSQVRKGHLGHLQRETRSSLPATLPCVRSCGFVTHKSSWPGTTTLKVELPEELFFCSAVF